MARKIFKIEHGLEIVAENGQSGAQMLQGLGAPSGTSGQTFDAPLGSLYLRTDGAGQLYRKSTVGGLATDWEAMSDASAYAALGVSADAENMGIMSGGTVLSDNLSVRALFLEIDAALSGATIAANVTYAGSTNLASSNVEDALDELDTEKAGLALANTFTGGETQTYSTKSGGTTLSVKAGAAGHQADLILLENHDSSKRVRVKQEVGGALGLVVSVNTVSFDNTVISDVTNPIAAQDAATKNYVDTAIGSLSSGLTYKGVLNAAGLGVQLDNGSKGDFWKVSVAGTILSSLELAIGDMVIVNDDYVGAPTNDKLDKIDNTEDPDILRTGTSFSGDVTGTYNNLQIGSGVVGATELASDAVITAKIADGQVTAVKLHADAIALIDAKVLQTITNGVTTSAPSQDAVFDALVSAIYKDRINSGIAASATSANPIGKTRDYYGFEIKVAMWQFDTPQNKEMFTIVALHNGTNAVDATTIDTTVHSKLKVGLGVPGITINVVLSGTGATQETRLALFSTSQCSFEAKIIPLYSENYTYGL